MVDDNDWVGMTFIGLEKLYQQRTKGLFSQQRTYFEYDQGLTQSPGSSHIFNREAQILSKREGRM